MKGELVIVDDSTHIISEFSVSFCAHDFSLEIYVDKEKTLEKQLKNKKNFEESMKWCKEFEIQMDEPNEDLEKLREYIKDNFDNLLDKVEFICLNIGESTVKDFIKANPIVLTKKIVINKILTINDYNELLTLMYEYEDMLDKIYVHFCGNKNYVSLKDCYKTMNIIKKQADEIANLKLSPLETIMYVYDQVRNRMYVQEGTGETQFKSRDLSEVLLGNKIVCEGYANIFVTLLDYLGIEGKKVYLINNDSNGEVINGHARNMIYIKDPKYGVDGVYCFDPTWDCKRNENDNSYLSRYKYFARTKKYMDNIKNYRYEDQSFPLYSDDIYEIVKNIIENKEISELLPYVKTIRNMANIVGEKKLIDINYIIPGSPFYGKLDIKKFLKRFKKIFSKFNKEISAETMIRLLNNVRKIEYYQNSEWYPYSVNDIYKTAMISDWDFEKEHLSEEERFIRFVFGSDELERSKKDDFTNYGKEVDLFRDIEQIRLTKVLQKIRFKQDN